VAARRHGETIDLRLDIADRFRISFQPCDVDLNVEVTNAARGSAPGSTTCSEDRLTCRRWHPQASQGNVWK